MLPKASSSTQLERVFTRRCFLNGRNLGTAHRPMTMSGIPNLKHHGVCLDSLEGASSKEELLRSKLFVPSGTTGRVAEHEAQHIEIIRVADVVSVRVAGVEVPSSERWRRDGASLRSLIQAPPQIDRVQPGKMS